MPWRANGGAANGNTKLTLRPRQGSFYEVGYAASYEHTDNTSALRSASYDAPSTEGTEALLDSTFRTPSIESLASPPFCFRFVRLHSGELKALLSLSSRLRELSRHGIESKLSCSLGLTKTLRLQTLNRLQNSLTAENDFSYHQLTAHATRAIAGSNLLDLSGQFYYETNAQEQLAIPT